MEERKGRGGMGSDRGRVAVEWGERDRLALLDCSRSAQKGASMLD